LIHATVWPQYTNVTDRQDRQHSDRIGQTKYYFKEHIWKICYYPMRVLPQAHYAFTEFSLSAH